MVKAAMNICVKMFKAAQCCLVPDLRGKTSACSLAMASAWAFIEESPIYVNAAESFYPEMDAGICPVFFLHLRHASVGFLLFCLVMC